MQKKKQKKQVVNEMSLMYIFIYMKMIIGPFYDQGRLVQIVKSGVTQKQYL